ncbi:MAG TPA: PRC-barrel domain-containing protein [Burkholderiales bacterium]
MACGAISAAELRGATVRRRDGSALGTLEDVLFDLDSGRVEYALIAPGQGEKLLAVPRDQLRFDADRRVVDADEETLAAAPAFTRDDLRGLPERVRAEIAARFGRAGPGR